MGKVFSKLRNLESWMRVSSREERRARNELSCHIEPRITWNDTVGIISVGKQATDRVDAHTHRWNTMLYSFREFLGLRTSDSLVVCCDFVSLLVSFDSLGTCYPPEQKIRTYLIPQLPKNPSLHPRRLTIHPRPATPRRAHRRPPDGPTP